MCLRFADMECKLGEIDRARAVYSFCSQMCDPRLTAGFWQTWRDFEVRHGNEDTLREMLRVKRSVQAKYNTQGTFLVSQRLRAEGAAASEDSREPVDDMKALEQRAAFVAAEAERDKPQMKDKILFVRSDASRAELAELTLQTNPDEINIGEEESEEDLEPDGELFVQGVVWELYKTGCCGVQY
ncbi:hypothetical protein FKM82_007486 [Ascaphus truei]